MAWNQQKGFSLIELIVVIALVGILSIALYPRLPTAVNFQYEVQRVINDLRYTQLLSMATGQRYRWVRSSANSYQILNEAGTAVMFSGGATTQVLSGNVVFSSTSLPNNLVAFDTLGAPYTDAAIPGTALGSTATINMSGYSQSQTIQILAQTGFVS